MIRQVFFPRAFLFLLSATLFALAPSDAQSGSLEAAPPGPQAKGGDPAPWVQTNGPSGGLINAVEIHPGQPDVLYAGGAGGGVFKTVDRGTTWRMLGQIVSPSQHIHDILISPDSPQTLYALAGRLYKSADGGQSWRVMDGELWFSCVAMDPADSFTLIGGTWDGHVYHSADGGENWTDVTGDLTGDGLRDVAIGASHEFWAGTANGSDGRLYHTTDGGVSWHEMDIGGRTETDIHTLFVKPGHGVPEPVLIVSFGIILP